MGRPLDCDRAREVLADEYASAEAAFREGLRVDVPDEICESTERLFASRTLAYREALIGCALARILDPRIDICLPYMNQGDDAFNGRTLDQTVVSIARIALSAGPDPRVDFVCLTAIGEIRRSREAGLNGLASRLTSFGVVVGLRTSYPIPARQYRERESSRARPARLH